MELKREEGYNINIDKLREKLNQKFDLFVWVNPNSPTGLHINKNEAERLLLNNKGCERIWIDETYVEYAGREQTLERFAEKSNNVFVCKSMSKVYALSGLRAAYLCANPNNIRPLKRITPPWVISLPAQIAATYALKQEDYYIKKYQETHELRGSTASSVRTRHAFAFSVSKQKKNWRCRFSLSPEKARQVFVLFFCNQRSRNRCA